MNAGKCKMQNVKGTMQRENSRPGISDFEFQIPSRGFPRGVSLIEVLVSTFVLSVGLMGLAVLLPVGRLTIMEAMKADRVGDCGRAALREIKARRMLDSGTWNAVGPPNLQQSFLIDPLGVTNPTGVSATPYGVMVTVGTGTPTIVNNASTFGDTASSGSTMQVPRISLFPGITAAQATAMAQQVFTWRDDITVSMPEDMTPPLPLGRPYLGSSASDLNVNYNGDYTWFLTVTPSPGDYNLPGGQITHFSVSIVVCQKRDFTEQVILGIPATFSSTTGGFMDNGVGGGSIQLPQGSALVGVKANDWVALCGQKSVLDPMATSTHLVNVCQWYRVAAISDDGTSLTLVGPDWDVANIASSAIIALGKCVAGVYTTTVELDQDPAWMN